ncbi:MAG TPA: sugar kinase, partial [Stellaceae bacterium]
ARIAAVGECMIELSQRDETTLSLAFGGDTLNTSVYLARSTPRDRVAVDYVTALGDDPYSDRMLAMWREEGIGADHVARLPGRLPGLYIIRIDEHGERRFFHYRLAAAVRSLFVEPSTLPLLARLATEYDLIYFSAITLSVLAAEARDRFGEALARARARGARVAFDSNYRATNWPDRETAQRTVARFLAEVDIGLPTADDEAALFGDADAEATIARYHAAGVAELALKLGRDGCVVIDRVGEDGGSSRTPVPTQPLRPVDTTAAGDAFNGGYLGRRLVGTPPTAAARAGNRLAGAVIGHRGAIIPRDATPDLAD